MSTTIYGASDDLIEVDGSVSEEFNALGNDEGTGGLLAFSNGVVLRVRYDQDGIWRITKLAGAEHVEIVQAPLDDDDNYTDRATLGDVEWVVYGSEWARS